VIFGFRGHFQFADQRRRGTRRKQTSKTGSVLYLLGEVRLLLLLRALVKYQSRSVVGIEPL